MFEATYRVGSVAGALKVDHAVQAGIGRAIALVAMGIKLLLGKDIPTILLAGVRSQWPLYGSSAVHGQGRGSNGGAEGSWGRGSVNIPRRRTRPWRRWATEWKQTGGEALAGGQWIDEGCR